MPQEPDAPPEASVGSLPPAATPAAARPAGAISRADPAAWLIALAVLAAYTTLSVFRYLRLQPGSWDLGIYTEYVRQIAHLHAPVVPIRSAGFNLLGDHFQPIVALIAPFFRVFPTPVTLLVAQALLAAVSVVAVCQAAQVLTGTGVSRAIGVAYGFSWGLQQMINFDFHEIAFAVPLLAFSLSALVRGRPRAATWWALPLVFVKEDQGFTVAAIGLIMLGTAVTGGRLRHRAGPAASGREWALAGGLLAVWGLAWSALAIGVIIPHFSAAHHYQYWQDGGVIGPGGSPFSLAGLLRQAAHGGTEKLGTLAMACLPVAFLALGSPRALAALPSLLLRFLSTNSYFWGTDWHYNATLMPVVFLAAVDVLARVRARAARQATAAAQGGAVQDVAAQGDAARAAAGPVRWRLAAGVPRYSAVVMLVITGWLAARQPLAGLWHPQTYVITPHVRAEQAAIARVPPATTVEATLSMLAPLAARDSTSWVGTVGLRDPRYLVFDATNSGWSPLPAWPPLRFEDERHPGAAYRQIFEASGVYVFRRTSPTSR
ncbi:MAG: DUF2079 domain-containing protein [Actinobacteria bacterium]|nr:DUF2079 domain-containing protein [Actinomycetota bacterium]